MAAVSSPGQKVVDRLAVLAVLLITLIFLAPIYWIASTAFKPRALATTVPPTVIFEPEITPFIKLFTKRVQLTRPVDPRSTPQRPGGSSASTTAASASSRSATTCSSRPTPAASSTA